MKIVDATFLGMAVQGGVDNEMKRRLDAVEEDLRSAYATSGESVGFETWCGLRQRPGGFHAGGYHGQGIAIDLNYDTNPYIATRTGSTFGGEAGFIGGSVGRALAVDVYDRAVSFTFSETDVADVSIRVNDSIEVTYDRFRFASDCLGYYLSHVFQWGDDRVWISRAPISQAQELADDDPAFAAISEGRHGERWPYSDAIQALTDTMESLGAGQVTRRFDVTDPRPAWRETHPNWPWSSPEQQYWQILRDYEVVRAPMLQGNASLPVTRTRNPANGFLDLPRHLVLSMVTTGRMWWGASDFGAGASGDMMHFDFGDHGQGSL